MSSPRSPSLAPHPCFILELPSRLIPTPFPSCVAFIQILTAVRRQAHTLFLCSARVMQQTCFRNRHQRTPRRRGRSLCWHPGQSKLLLCHHKHRCSGWLSDPSPNKCISLLTSCDDLTVDESPHYKVSSGCWVYYGSWICDMVGLVCTFFSISQLIL